MASPRPGTLSAFGRGRRDGLIESDLRDTSRSESDSPRILPARKKTALAGFVEPRADAGEMEIPSQSWSPSFDDAKRQRADHASCRLTSFHPIGDGAWIQVAESD